MGRELGSLGSRKGTDPDESSRQELNLVLEVIVPAHCLFFGTVGIDDDLHVEAVFAFLVAFRSGHGVFP